MKPRYNSNWSQKIFFASLLFLLAIRADATKHIINVQNYSFSPSSLTINLGDTMEWHWIQGSHTTTSATIPAGAAGWDHEINPNSGNLIFDYVPSVTGTYNYICTNHDGMGATFTVSGCTPPTSAQATITAGGPTTFCKGNSVTLTVAASGMTYAWKKGNMAISGATAQSYLAKKAGTYKCDVSNSCGSITSNSIAVTVNPSPTATETAGSCSGGAVLLTCSFTPATGVTFKWKKGSMVISGATNSTYSATMNGTYKCIVTITASGCSKTSMGVTVSISCKTGNNVVNPEMLVYPNPTSDYFHVNTSRLEPDSKICIYDYTGRMVECHDVTDAEMKVGQSLSNGIYFMKVMTNNESLDVIKLVKNR